MGLHPFPVSDAALDISSRQIPGVTHINKFGRNADCDKIVSITAVPVGRDVWGGSGGGAGNWVPPTTSRIHALVSTSDEDGKTTPTGALTVFVEGLGSTYEFQSETVTLDGTTTVNTVLEYTMIHRMNCLTFGSAGRNLGLITATAAVDGTVTAEVVINSNSTLMAIFQVPANTSAYMTGWHGSIFRQLGAAQATDLFLMSHSFGAVAAWSPTGGNGFAIRDIMALDSDGNPENKREYHPYKLFPAKSYIKVAASGNTDGQDVGAGFDLILEPAR